MKFMTLELTAGRGLFGCLADQINSVPGADPGLGGWIGNAHANRVYWDSTRRREWRCWAQSGPTHCGETVEATDPLGLCTRHRRQLLGDQSDTAPPPSS
jgi:hypothetical protein